MQVEKHVDARTGSMYTQLIHAGLMLWRASQRATVCCSVLQCVAVRCSVLHISVVEKGTSESCSVLQCVAVCCSVLQCIAN